MALLENAGNTPREHRRMVLDMLDGILGNQSLSRAERAEIMDAVAASAARMARGLRQRTGD